MAVDRGLEAGALQKPTELAYLLDAYAGVASGLGVLEVGCDTGGTLLALAERVRGAQCVGVTLHGAAFSTRRPMVEMPASVTIIEGDSRRPATYALALEVHPRPFDLVFIDADHSYDGVRSDFNVWAQRARRGGLVAFHDICPHDPTTGCEVERFWHEVSERWSGPVESFADEPFTWGGVGLLGVPA